MPEDINPEDPVEGPGGGVDPSSIRNIIYPLDKRPIKVIDFYDPNRDDSLTAQWSNVNTAYDWLSAEIVGGYQREYRRFLFNLPAGNDLFNTLTNGSIWGPLSSAHKELLLGDIATLIGTYAALGCEFGIMAGLYIDTIDKNTMVNPRLPQPTNRDDAAFIHDNWINWLNIGITSFAAYDGMDPNDTEVFPRLQAYLSIFWSRGFKVYGRGLPKSGDTSLSSALLEKIGTTSPWSELREFEYTAGLQNISTNQYEIFIDLHPDNSSALLGEETYPFSSSDVTSLLTRGFYVSSWGNTPEDEEMIMSIYKEVYPQG